MTNERTESGGKVLVTGASGLTGSRLCKSLRNSGRQVVAFVRSSSHVDALKAAGVECRIVDITSANEVMDAFEDFEVVYHIAAAYRTEHRDNSVYRWVNVEASRNLLEAAKQYGAKRFVHCSTVGVQGEIEHPPASENYRYNPGDHYQESKMDGELLALKYFEEGLPGCVVRPVGIYGPGDVRFLKLFRPISRGRFVMIGSGEVLYHLTFIDDLVQGIICAGTHPAALGEVFTIGGPEYSTLNQLVAMIADACGVRRPRIHIPLAPVYWTSVVCDRVCKLVGVRPPLYPRRVEFFRLDRAFSIEKARSLIGYRPEYPLERGLATTAKWYRQQGLI